MRTLGAVVVRLASSTTVDERLAALAGRQRGLVSRAQALAAGIDPSAVDRRIASGRLAPMHRGVYAVGHKAPGPLRAETAALLAMRAGAVLSHRSAALRWGISVPRAARDTLVHVTVAGPPGGMPAGVRTHRSAILERRDLRVRDGLPLTAPARTALDLAAEDPSRRELERSVEDAVAVASGGVAEITEVLERAGGHQGRAALGRLLHDIAGPSLTRSEAEERFLALVADAGLPRPLTNVVRHGYELDVFWPAHRVVVEIDGFDFHRSRAAFEHDRRKGADLQARGITVVRFTWRRLVEEPISVAVTVAQTLARQAPAADR